MMHLNNSIRYKRSFVNINPQSNTDFTQVTCTVHFYYNLFFTICLRDVIESLLTAFLWILIEVSFQIGWTHELLVVSHEFPLLLCVHCGFMMNLAYAANSTKICQLFRIIYSSFLLFPGDFQCWKPRLLRSVYWLKIRFFQSLATSGTRTPLLKRSTRSA